MEKNAEIIGDLWELAYLDSSDGDERVKDVIKYLSIIRVQQVDQVQSFRL